MKKINSLILLYFISGLSFAQGKPNIIVHDPIDTSEVRESGKGETFWGKKSEGPSKELNEAYKKNYEPIPYSAKDETKTSPIVSVKEESVPAEIKSVENKNPLIEQIPVVVNHGRLKPIAKKEVFVFPKEMLLSEFLNSERPIQYKVLKRENDKIIAMANGQKIVIKIDLKDRTLQDNATSLNPKEKEVESHGPQKISEDSLNKNKSEEMKNEAKPAIESLPIDEKKENIKSEESYSSFYSWIIFALFFFFAPYLFIRSRKKKANWFEE